MESSSSIGREDLLCSICLDVFTEPVSIPCGHSFCMACIKKHWNSDDVCQCPLCMEKFFRKPELRVNTTFRIFVAKFKKIEVKHADEIEQSTVEPGEIPCDVCTGGKLKALKSCLVCQTSYCETHLEPHHIAQSLKKHKLMDHVENLEDWLCKKHNKLLELFCRTDKTCACQICPETDHRFHYVVSLEDECEERKVQLGVTKAEVQQLIHERAKKLQEIKLSVETSKRDAEREISDSVEVFTALVRSIEKSHAQLIGMITEKLKETEREAERIIDELRKEISQLTRRNDELDELLHTDNLIHVIQSFPTVSTPPHTEDWSGVSVYSDLSVGAVRRAVSRQEETLVMEMRKLCQAELRRIQQYAVDETLDPDTANPQLILSEDGKQVRYGQTRKSLPELPARFDRGVNVLGKQGFSSGRVYYEVQVEGKTDWDLGVAAESVKRKGMIILDPLNGYWSIALRDGQGYIACTTSSLRLSLKEKSQKVGVFVDYEEGLVSFYDVEARCHIYSFTGCTFTEKLHLFLSPSLSKRGKNSGPLTISNVSQR